MKSIFLLALAAGALLAQQQQRIERQVMVAGAPAMGVNTGRTFTFMSGELIGGETVKSAPYSGEGVTESIQVLADGNRIVNKNSAQIYRDSEGRQRREQSIAAIGPFAAQGTAPKMVFISDPVAGVNYSLNATDHTAMKMPVPDFSALPPMPPGAKGEFNVMINSQTAVRGVAGAGSMATVGMVGPPPPGGPQVVYMHNQDAVAGITAPAPPAVEQLGTKVIEGVSAEGTRIRVKIPAGQMGNEREIEMLTEQWRSPELKVIVYSEHSDPRMGKTTYTLRNINRAEPDPTLFKVPADYAVKEGPTFERAIPATPGVRVPE